MSHSRSEIDNKIRNTNWLGRFAARYCDSELSFYLPLQQTLPTELDSYQGKFSGQQDYLYFKSMMQCENYPERKKPFE